jgi:glycosyltransferase involved in cell wall biosynthesis
MAKPFISICIPAYKRVEFLERLLNSIAVQSFHDFEVILSDDSPGDEVKTLLPHYPSLPVVYLKNEKPLGTPANWNHAIKYANGDWVKLMHDDDWFSSPDSLAEFARVASANAGTLIFSAYSNYYFQTGKKEDIYPKAVEVSRIKKDPVALISNNIIGPPSVIMHRNNSSFLYDEQLKWLVDIDYYIQRSREEAFVYLDKTLINVGLGEEQVTQDCFRVPGVELPEHYIFLQKTGIGHLKNIWIYDAWWRLFRNLEIFTAENLHRYADHAWHPLIYRIIADASRVKKLISFGPFSKLFMFASYLRNRSLIK